LRLEVEDDGPGFTAETFPAGHGLDLLKSRLELAFANRATLRVDSVPGRSCISVEMPFSVRAEPSGSSFLPGERHQP
jgi:signal transduction histidine kinase